MLDNNEAGKENRKNLYHGTYYMIKFMKIGMILKNLIHHNLLKLNNKRY